MKYLVSEYRADYSASNFSDHIPLIIKLDLDISYLKPHKIQFKPCVSWNNCDSTHTDNYKNDLYRLLLKINNKSETISCNTHNDYIQKLHGNVLRYMGKALGNCLSHISQIITEK